MSEANIEIQAEYYRNIPILDRKFKSCSLDTFVFV